MSLINFFSEDTSFVLKEKNKIRSWIITETKIKRFEIEEINIIICSDEYLYNLNKDYLNHHYYTDVITFDNSYDNILSGEIYISIDRVKENAKNLKIAIFEELLRIIIHGVLHLMKYSDKKPEDKLLMTEQENRLINLYRNSQ